MFLFGPKGSYATNEAAKRTREKAKEDRSFDKPGAEEKLLKKLPSIKNENMLFYYALLDRPAVRAAAIAQITDPNALHMIAQLGNDDSDALRNLVDNPHTTENDIRSILWNDTANLRKDGLRRYIIEEKLHSENDILDAALNMKSEDTRECAISCLTQKSSFLTLIKQSPASKVSAAVDRLRELFSETADRDLYELLLGMLANRNYAGAAELRDNLKLSDKMNQDLDKEILSAISKDTRLQPKKQKNALGISITPEASMDIYEMRPVIRLLDSVTPGKALYSFVRKWNTSSVLLEKDKYAADQAVLEAVVPKLTLEQLKDLVINYVDKCPVAKTLALRILAKEKDGPQLILDVWYQIKKKEAEDSSILRNFIWSISDEKTFALLLDNIPDSAKEKKTLVERILWISKSEDLIVRCLTEYDMANASPIFNLSEEGRKTVALKARNAYVRSEAARTLQKTGHVRVLRDRCTYCGAEVVSEYILAGTIEAHFLYRCTGCGRTEHQTILGSVELKRDIYVYDETE